MKNLKKAVKIANEIDSKIKETSDLLGFDDWYKEEFLLNCQKLKKAVEKLGADNGIKDISKPIVEPEESQYYKNI